MDADGRLPQVKQKCGEESFDMEEPSHVYTGCAGERGEGDGPPPAPQRLRPPQEEVEEEVKLRRKIKYFFMNPCDKYHARGRKPWKLMLQIIKIAIITAQLVSFGLSNQTVVTFKEENLTTFKHLFLKGYVDGGLTKYALYSQDDVYDHIEHVLQQYGRLRNITVGNHEYDKNGALYTPLSLCQEYYRNGTIYPGNDTFEIDAQLDTCILHQDLSHVPVDTEGSTSWFRNTFQKVCCRYSVLVSIKITFVLKAINLETVRHRELPDCYDFNIMILFNNQAHSGMIKVDLDNDVEINECRDWKVTGAGARNPYFPMLFDILIIMTCVMSMALCTRSVLNGIQLQFEYTVFCKDRGGEKVPWSDRFDFINGWYILIIVSDTLTIVGSVLKIAIQAKVLTSYDVCSIFLGLGTMFVWIGVIRYMGYFKKYNILILTLRAAFPNVIRFICCAGIIYLSYCFCGWIVLGPYHEKFRTLNTVSECLFSLINGDDMFPTFKNMQQKSQLVWAFSRVYLYTFICLFIYMILSLFVTLITNTYDTIKQQQNATPTSELQKFTLACEDLPNSGVYRINEKPNCFLCCIPR
ncbi:unnamed protein product [Lota lota]